jgi:hypothetical protein
MVDRLVNIQVGWGEPTEDGDFIFNFHIQMGRTSWREMTDYKSLSALNIAFKDSREEFKTIPFPHFGKKESAFIVSVFQETRYDKEKIKAIERHRSLMEIWINTITDNIARVSSETRRLCHILFFTTDEYSARFEAWMRSQGIFDSSSLESIEEGEESSQKSNHLIYSLLNGNHKSKSAPLTLSRRNLDKTLKKKDYLRGNVAGTETVYSDSKTEGARSIFSNMFGQKAKSVMSDEDPKELVGDEAIQALSAHNKIHILLTTEVLRSQESHSGVQVYSVHLRVTGKGSSPILFRVFQRYNVFKQLWHKLLEINDEITNKSTTTAAAAATSSGNKSLPYANFIKMITSPFPASPVKSYLGLSLNEAELQERYAQIPLHRSTCAEIPPLRFPMYCVLICALLLSVLCRTRMLDRWFRDVCYFYRDMPASAREAVRGFINFDMKVNKDIFVHDQLAWGTIEPNKEDGPVLIVRKSTVVNLHDSALDVGSYEAGAKKSIRYNLKESSDKTSTESSSRVGARVAVDVKSMNGSILRPHATGKKAGSVA